MNLDDSYLNCSNKKYRPHTFRMVNILRPGDEVRKFCNWYLQMCQKDLYFYNRPHKPRFSNDGIFNV